MDVSNVLCEWSSVRAASAGEGFDKKSGKGSLKAILAMTRMSVRCKVGFEKEKSVTKIKTPTSSEI